MTKLRFPELKPLVLLLPLILLAGCDSWQEGWTEEYRQQFTQACLSGDGRLHANPDAYCNCALEKTMQHYPTIAAFMERRDSVAYQQAIQTCP